MTHYNVQFKHRRDPIFLTVQFDWGQPTGRDGAISHATHELYMHVNDPHMWELYLVHERDL